MLKLTELIIYIYETKFWISTKMYTSRERRKIEKNVMNRKDNIEYPLHRYCTDLKENGILIYLYQKWELNYNKRISRDNVNKKQLSLFVSSPYSARGWLSIDTFSLELAIIHQCCIFRCQNLQRQCKCGLWSKNYALIKIHETFYIPGMVSLISITMVL